LPNSFAFIPPFYPVLPSNASPILNFNQHWNLDYCPLMNPAIVLEHSSFLIVDKPAGWLVHPTRPDGTFTLIDWLRDQYPDEFLSLVSRLDRETSGLLLVARGKENASLFGKMQ